MQNIIVGAIIFIIFSGSIYFSIKKKGSSCSSCNNPNCSSSCCSSNDTHEH